MTGSAMLPPARPARRVQSIRCEEKVGGCTLLLGDCRERLAELPDESVHCCVTSPPYFGLRSYLPDGHPDKEREVGLERTLDAYVARLVEVFREVRRVLRPDGTLWLNLGDSYAGGGGGNYGNKIARDHGQHVTNVRNRPGWLAANGLKPKDLIGVPWMVAFALRADGWWLRRDNIWNKPNPMPESVTDRPTSSHEYVFLLTKSARYFFDAEAVQEDASTDAPHKDWRDREHDQSMLARKQANGSKGRPVGVAGYISPGKRNVRSVWTIATQPCALAHFAVMPDKLAERCIKAGTSERGCCQDCGAPWEREVERRPMEVREGPGRAGLRAAGNGSSSRTACTGTMVEPPRSRTVGWCPTCSCAPAEPVPCTVLDPFAGAGTTLLVASRLQRRGIGIELDERSLRMAADRIRNDSPLFAGAAA